MARPRSRFVDATYVKHNVTGGVFQVVAKYRTTLWLLDGSDKDTVPFNAPDEHYSPHVPSPEVDEHWEGIDFQLDDVRVMLITPDDETGKDVVVFRNIHRPSYGVLSVEEFTALYRKVAGA